MLASEPASNWWDDSHHHSTTSFKENVIVVETRNFIILRSGEGLTSSNKDNSVNFSGEKKKVQWSIRVYGKAGIRNRSRKRNRKRKRKRNRNLRNKTWRRFYLKSVTNNNCSIKTFYPHIIFTKLLLYFLVSYFLRTAQNFSLRISYTRECCNLWSWLTWVLLLPLLPFPHNGWNTEPF